MKLIVYLPAYNEELKIENVIDNLPKKIRGVNRIDYLVVDDGSTDKTAALAQSSGAQVISHYRNQGVGAAFHSAVQFALENGADILVGIDADGQFDSAEIHMLIKPIITAEADMVIGSRFASGKPVHMSRVKYWGNHMIAGLISLISCKKFEDLPCGFRAYSREALMRFNIFGKFTYTHEAILSLVYQRLNVTEYPIQVRYYPERKSRVAKSLFRYAVRTSKIIFRVMLDYKPLIVFGVFGGAMLAIGLGFEVFMLVYYVIFSKFIPYKAAGFIGLGFVIFGLLVLLIALITDMLNRMRANQDKLLYEQKKARYKK